MKKIDTIADLKSEKIRLVQKKLLLENEIKNNYTSLKKSLNPVQLMTDGAAKMLVNPNHGLVNNATGLIIDFLLKKVFLRNSGFILRLILPFIAKNSAGNLIADNKTKILGWIGDLILKVGNKKEKQPVNDRTTADINSPV